MMVLSLVSRTILIYVVVFAVMRMMGKREIGKLSVTDLVVSIMIAEIAVFVIEDTRKPLLEGLVPIATLVIMQIIMAFAALRSRRLRQVVDGKPSILIEHGKINRDEMKKQRYNLDDLLIQLRQNKILNIADVEFAVLEPTGKLTVLEKGKKEEQAEEPRRDSIRFEGLPLPLIMDGKVQDGNLEKLGQTRFWLKNELRRRGITDFKDVFFCSIDHRGRLFIDKSKR